MLSLVRSQILVIVVATAGCGFRTGNRVLIPDGYIGWVQVFYREPEYPPLRKDAGKYLIEIDKSGRAHTSSAPPVGYGIDEYFYVSSTGTRTQLKLQDTEEHPDDVVRHFTLTISTHNGKSPKEFQTFFVGPQGAEKTKPAPELEP